MLTDIYVIDYVLRNLDGAKEKLDRIFGTEPLWLDPTIVPGAGFRAMYYQLPGNDERSHALGLFQSGNGAIESDRDRVFLIGIMCDDLPATMREISDRGLAFVHAEPERYAVGESNSLGSLHGLEIFIARHDPGGDRKAREMMFTQDGSSDFGDETQGGLLQGVVGIDLAVSDFQAAVDTYAKVFGTQPIDTTARTCEPGIVSAHFTAPGGGQGVREVGIFAVDESDGRGHFAKRLSDILQERGEGVFRIDFQVKDLAAMQAKFAERGLYPAAGDALVFADVHGTDLRFVEKPASC